jgi:hypothetical protein
MTASIIGDTAAPELREPSCTLLSPSRRLTPRLQQVTRFREPETHGTDIAPISDELVRSPPPTGSLRRESVGRSGGIWGVVGCRRR